GFYRFFELYLTHPNGTEVLMATFREWDESVPPSNPLNSRYALGPFHGFGVVQSYGGDSSNLSQHQVLIDSFSARTIPSSISDKIYFFEDYMDRDLILWNTSSAQDRVTDQTPFMEDEKIVTNSDYVGANIFYCSRFPGDISYPANRVQPTFIDQNIQLGACGSLANDPRPGWASLLRLLPKAADRTPPNPGGVTDVSMVIGVNRIWYSHDGAYPHVWMCGRLFNTTSQWASRYRLRISRFDCVSDYPLVGPEGLSQGDKVWRISAYNSGSGVATDIPAVEEFLIIGTHTSLDWTEYSIGSVGERENRSVWNYFRIDMYNVGPPENHQISFDVYVGSDLRTIGEEDENIHPDEIDFQFLVNLTIDRITNTTDGHQYAIALFSGSYDESTEGLIGPGGTGDDYSSSAYINYVALSTIGPIGGPETGACCHSMGGCTEDVLSEDCLDPDVWKVELTCEQASCQEDFAVGAGCTN
ncbi:hypothetical protein LCGC14_2580290, partial [marine sediment metagenome]